MTTKEQFDTLKNEEDKSLFLELLYFSEYADVKTYLDFLTLDDLEAEEVAELLSYLCRTECYFMMSYVLNHCKKQLYFTDEAALNRVSASHKFERILEEFDNLK